MIQRIQSIFLLLSSALTGGYLFTPGTELNDQYTSAMEHLPLLIGAIIAAAISFAAIFLFRNRPNQLNVVRINMLALFVTVCLSIWIEFGDGDFNPYYGAFLPLIAFVFSFLASKAIRKDEHLVKSMDRLR